MNHEMYMMPPGDPALHAPNDLRLWGGYGFRPFGYGYGFGRPFFGYGGFGMPFGYGFGYPFFGGFPFFI